MCRWDRSNCAIFPDPFAAKRPPRADVKPDEKEGKKETSFEEENGKYLWIEKSFLVNRLE